MSAKIEILRHFIIDNCHVKVASVEPLGAPGALVDALPQLSQYRREKVMRYRFDRGKWLSAGAGLLLDNMLREHGLCERDMTYVEGEHGKPAFASHPELHFNLSHSATLVACALGDRPMGVDVQQFVDPRPSLVRYVMSDQEIEALEALGNDDDAKRLLFTQLWSLKECYAKATGLGLSHDFPSFKITGNTVTPLSPLTPTATFHLATMPDAVVALAIL
ncbi:MAG: 4'-phosphopantetheinyl transferase superfamily protein [Muribaculaceae bacterium]|nr:4'-phosphopantetheinyl transferase superfamily protein [Muribaculaceae bacterium]